MVHLQALAGIIRVLLQVSVYLHLSLVVLEYNTSLVVGQAQGRALTVVVRHRIP